ncbi:hypothetical protein A8990_15338 [Paenibacillus taihuensis]|uniref:AB hydrolase-1 domain-containing protein n=1 Tax=Paenibacillus taihuensis TaxID=1156355 RepID=A0A3D9Q7G7_9BACL|nr:alpha/beta fold hydrolase [Paenibacillus taihuensis]REE57528.1 hypothetical protein A8990_15338 [Paenibacillus taihuensis]
MSNTRASEQLAPQLNAIQIPAEAGFIVARIFSPGGQGPFPTVVLSHGFPGVQQNYDLAAQLQHAGYQAVVFHYRGLWGSKGEFSVSRALEDMKTVLAYLRHEETSAKYQIDVQRVAVVGHSFGGFVALQTAAADSGIAAVASLSGANLGLMAQLLMHPESRAQLEAAFDEPASYVTGHFSSKMMGDEILAHAPEWNLLDRAQILADRPVLLVGAALDAVTPVKFNHDPLVSAFQGAGAEKMQSLIIEATEHGYEGKRQELFEVVLRWLNETV